MGAGSLHRLPIALWRSCSPTGICVGILFFSASLTPSLVPRESMLQGPLSGLSMAVGYGVGVLAAWLWSYLELSRPRDPVARAVFAAGLATCLAVAAVFLWQASAWQDSVRTLMGLEPASGGDLVLICALALVVFFAVLMIGRLFVAVWRLVARPLQKFVPRRVANVVAVLVAAVVFVSVTDGLVFRRALRFADSTYETLDALTDIEVSRPNDSLKAGSPASLIDWRSMGRRGREFIVSGPAAADIEELGVEPALDPLRVYVGLRSAETPEARARLALDELNRIGAFERSVLVVATPTGTGWMDPNAFDTLEYLHGGDVATVAVQYSYLASWLSLIVEPGYGAESSRALFFEVYRHWTTLPEDDRPRLYLFGLSLGALSSERSAQLYEVLKDPHQGALWAGPPFASSIWQRVTRGREAGSPVWLPKFGDGSVVRFTSQRNALDSADAAWGPIRVVYLQYASDPITFFEPAMFFRRPTWLSEPRGPDVSPQLRWYPFITALQVGVDIILATEVPAGFGHHYAAAHYIDGWLEVTEPPGWDAQRVGGLKSRFRPRQ